MEFGSRLPCRPALRLAEPHLHHLFIGGSSQAQDCFTRPCRLSYNVHHSNDHMPSRIFFSSSELFALLIRRNATLRPRALRHAAKARSRPPRPLRCCILPCHSTMSQPVYTRCQLRGCGTQGRHLTRREYVLSMRKVPRSICDSSPTRKARFAK